MQSLIYSEYTVTLSLWGPDCVFVSAAPWGAPEPTRLPKAHSW